MGVTQSEQEAEMASNDKFEKATESVEELCKTLIATSGIMLALLWGLTQRDVGATPLWTIRLASIVLIVSIISSLLGLQFIVTKLESNVANITKEASVAYSFLVGWLSFILGCILVILAIFQIN